MIFEAGPSSIVQDYEEENSFFRLSSYTKRDTWYPTLRSTLSVLTQLHDFVQVSIFP